MDQILGFVLLALVILVIYLSWPVSLWLAVTLGAIGAFHLLAKDLEEGSAWRAITKALRDTGIWISVGLAVVAIAQVVLTAVDIISPTDVLAWEQGAIAAQEKVASALSFRVLVPTLIVLLMVAIEWPRTKAMTRFVRLRKLVKPILLVLTAITSFSFFSSVAITADEKQWVAQRRQKTKDAIARVDAKRRELVALVWTDSAIRSLPPATIRDLRDALKPPPSGWVDTWELREIAQAVTRTAPSLPNDSRYEKTAFRQVRVWEEPAQNTPSLANTIVVISEAEHLDKLIPELESGVTEALKTAVGELIPGGMDSLLRPFVKAVAGALVENRLSSLFRDDVTDKQSASQFVQTFGTPWRWDVPKRAPDSDQPGHTSGSPQRYGGSIGGFPDYSRPIGPIHTPFDTNRPSPVRRRFAH